MAALVALATVTTAAGAMEADDAYAIVREEVVNQDLQAFTATIEAVGNGHRLNSGSGFEPLVFRTIIQTTAASQNRIIAQSSAISNWDTWRTGLLDGADVEILRIEDGVFRSVRRDRVSENGHQANGWLRETPSNRVIAPTESSYDFSLRSWHRRDTRYHFSIRTLDRTGQLSPTGVYVSIIVPANLPNSATEADHNLLELETLGDDGRLGPPEQIEAMITPDGTVRLTWPPVNDAAGYVLFRSDTHPSEHRGYYLELSEVGPLIQEGDLAIIRTRLFEADRDALLTNRAWGSSRDGRPFLNGSLRWPDQEGGDWHLVPHASDTPVEQPGETFVRISLGEGETRTIGNWNYSGTGQSFFPVLEPGKAYHVDFWMRGDVEQSVIFELTGFFGHEETEVDPINFQISHEWQQYRATFEVPQLHTGEEVGQTRLRLLGPGVFDLDNFRVFQADTEFLSFLPRDVERLQSSGMNSLRTHSFIKTGHGTYDLAELTNSGGVSNTQGGNTLPQVLSQIDRVGMNPWLQIEPHLSREEWLGLAEYLAAPFDPTVDDEHILPWAAKRAEQGYGPWVDRFDRILFEIGNETWNNLFSPWTFPSMTDFSTEERYSPGAVYGLYQEYVLGILRESPHWPALDGRLESVIGGWSGSTGWSGFDYGLDAATISPNTLYMTHAAYNGGWDENAGPAQPTEDGLFSVLTHVLQTGIPRAQRHQEAAQQIGVLRGARLLTGTYEAGPGYAMNGLNGANITAEDVAQQELAMKSVAAGTATLDAFLMRAAHGQILQNFFTYRSGQYWTSHAPWYLGGHAYPAWDLLSLFNREALGDMLLVEIINGPTVDLEESNRRQAVEDGSLVAIYATRSASRLTVVLISRRVPNQPLPGDGNIAVTVDLPISRAEQLTIYSQTGNWQSSNAHQQSSFVQSENVAVPSTLPRLNALTLPPGEMLMYVFDGIQ